MWLEVVALLVGYLFGSIPFVYLIGRLRGIDLRRHGSGNVGAGNLWQTVGPVEGAIGGLLDASKGALPAAVSLRLGFELPAVALAGLGGVSGQCWPAFWGVKGGRGVAAMLGLLLVIAPQALVVGLIPIAVGAAMRALPLLFNSEVSPWRERFRLRGRPSRSLPLSVAIGLAIAPVAAWLSHEPTTIVVTALLIFLIMAVRRVTAELKDDLATAGDRKAIMANRFLYDRPHP
ncbi:MAG: glycerol-3-phosphate acyltransferase [Chloroflexi bacterium]|nr:glycerol-3-phosphate acyltransferase [Chloroflexota bacterium]